MLYRYEVLLLAVPEITQDESRDVESSIEKIIEKINGKLLSFERWGKYRLAYPVQNNEYGIYFLGRFEIPKDAQLLNDIESLLKVKYNDIIMRSVVTRLPDQGPLTYQRPRSLEEAPTTRESTIYTEDRQENRENRLEEMHDESGIKDLVENHA